MSRIRRHKILALFLVILIIVVAVSATVAVYTYTSLLATPCPADATPFQNSTMPPRTVYQLIPPGKAEICLTVWVTGRLPFGGLSLAPGIGLYTTSQYTSTYSACSNPWTNCGGVAVSASPARTLFPTGPIRVVVTINAPAGSTRGVYWVFFSDCGGAMMWLRIGSLNQTLSGTPQASQCLFIPWRMSATLNSYTGMIPVYQNGSQVLF